MQCNHSESGSVCVGMTASQVLPGNENGKEGSNNPASAAMGCQVGPVRRRWFILAIFALTSMAITFHWILYTTISDVITQHYNVSFLAVNWSATIFSALYVSLVFPASWFIDKYGLRVALLLCGGLLTIGSWIQVYAVQPDHFAIVFAGQIVIATAQVFCLGAPGRVAALWFGTGEVSLACALAVFGNQLGIALGFLLPPLFVKSGDEGEVASQLRLLCIIYAITSSIIFILIIFFFSECPPRPPSAVQAQVKAQQATSLEKNAFLHSVKTLLTMPSFMLLLVCYGLTIGSFGGVSTVLNPLVLSSFPGANQAVGIIGLIMVLVGMVGSVVSGAILNAWRKFKEMTVAVLFLGALSMAVLMTALHFRSMPLVYVAVASGGACTAGFSPIGFEFGVEITHPISEATVVGLIAASGELMSVVLSQWAVLLQEQYGNIATTGAFVATLTLAFLLCCFIRNDLKRLAAAQKLAQHTGTGIISTALPKTASVNNNDLKA